jgi:D-sedoheptulose 7-phosphate isomerase
LKELIIKRFRESADLKTAFAKKSCDKIIEIVNLIAKSLKSGNKIMLFGNGGSAADAQHIAAEFINRLQKSKRDRPPLAALALTTDTSVLTSISNELIYTTYSPATIGQTSPLNNMPLYNFIHYITVDEQQKIQYAS